MSPEGTGTGTGMITEPPKAPATAYDGLARQVGEVRDVVHITKQDAEGLHEQLQGRALDSRTAAVAQREPAELLDDLSAEWGLWHFWKCCGPIIRQFVTRRHGLRCGYLRSRR